MVEEDPGMPRSRIVAWVLALALSVVPPAVVRSGAQESQETIGRTPPRLSFVDGQVSFFRPGAQEWAQAQVNIALAPGDELYTGAPGNFEIQVGSRAFVRAWANTQIGLTNQEPDFVQFKVTTGHASFDVRTIEPGRTIEIDTPNAAFTIEQAGYYRVDVNPDQTSFITRRGGRAAVTPASGQAASVNPSEEVVVSGGESPRVASYVAPQLDEWDRWNYARTDALVEAVSARYVSSDVYGVRDLDRYGTWRVVNSYGSVWVPSGVPTGWVPYSTGSWTLDPTYGWTWVDTAPWGWAPYHYGRWVYVNGFWAWAPGPVVVRPVYAPALVAFYGAPRPAVAVVGGGPLVAWVALGWGEPCVPWWGPAGFVHTAWWGGWGGPRVVNNVVINKTTVVNVTNINVYQNTTVKNAVVAVNEQRFGQGPVAGGRVTVSDPHKMDLLRAAPQVTASAASFEPTSVRGVRPPERALNRQVVATRAPSPVPEPPDVKENARAARVGPAPRLVTPPERGSSVASPRPPFGEGNVERQSVDKPQPPAPPRFETTRQPAPPTGGAVPPPHAATNPRRDDAAGSRREDTSAAPPRPAPPAPDSGGQPRSTRTPGDNASRRANDPRPQPAPPPPAASAPSAAPSAPRSQPGAARQQPSAVPPPPASPQPGPASQAPSPAAPRAHGSQPGRSLPGEPANRLAPTHAPAPAARDAKAQQPAPAPSAAPRPAGGGHPAQDGGGAGKRDASPRQ